MPPTSTRPPTPASAADTPITSECGLHTHAMSASAGHSPAAVRSTTLRSRRGLALQMMLSTGCSVQRGAWHWGGCGDQGACRTYHDPQSPVPASRVHSSGRLMMPPVLARRRGPPRGASTMAALSARLRLDYLEVARRHAGALADLSRRGPAVELHERLAGAGYDDRAVRLPRRMVHADAVSELAYLRHGQHPTWRSAVSTLRPCTITRSSIRWVTRPPGTLPTAMIARWNAGLA